jgi:hypothetical protein
VLAFGVRLQRQASEVQLEDGQVVARCLARPPVEGDRWPGRGAGVPWRRTRSSAAARPAGTGSDPQWC